MVRLILIGKRIYNKFSEDEMTVYAAQVSFFVILSVVPFLMLLLTAVQMIPGISKADFLEIAMDIVPADYRSLAFRVVNDLMLKSPATMISATAVTALWSAGRGMFSVARGLNRVNGRGKKHWYVFNRLIGGSTAWSRTGKKTSKLLCRGLYFPQPAGCFFLLHFPCISILQVEKTIPICMAVLQLSHCHFCGFISVYASCLWERN